MAQQVVDVVVIGAGPAGENVAAGVVAEGLEAVVVERELVGGECSYWACMPSKALLRPGEALAAARRVPGAAPAVTGEVDVEATLRSRDAFISGLDDAGQVQWLDDAGVPLVRGHGRLAGARTVEVTTADGAVTTLEARRAVVVATGTSAAMPPIDGLADARPWDNRQVTTAKDIPARLVVLGGGVVGSEMAQAYRRLGAEQVTIVEMMDRLLPNEEPFVGDDLAEALRDDGITVRVGERAVRVERDAPDAPVTVVLASGDAVTGDELLVATGRRANTGDLGLDTVGLEPARPIDVDDQLRATAVDGGWLYAVGDVNGRSLLTHMGKYQARIAARHIAGAPVAAWADHRAAPRVVFTDPQVAAVGRTERAARAAGIAVRTTQHPLGAVAGAALLGRGVAGRSLLVIDDDRDVLVGATFTGPGVGELVHAATIAIAGEVPIDTLWHAVPAFPTVSEVWLRLLEHDRA